MYDGHPTVLATATYINMKFSKLKICYVRNKCKFFTVGITTNSKETSSYIAPFLPVSQH